MNLQNQVQRLADSANTGDAYAKEILKFDQKDVRYDSKKLTTSDKEAYNYHERNPSRHI